MADAQKKVYQRVEMTPEERKAAKAEKKRKKEEAKKLKAAKKAAREQATKDAAAAKAAKLAGMSNLFGDLPRIMSQDKNTGKKWTRLTELVATGGGAHVLVRGRVHKVRGQAKRTFIELRQRTETVQLVVQPEGNVPKEMVKFCMEVPCESVVDITGTIAVVSNPTSCSISGIEINVETFQVVCRGLKQPPFVLEDAARSAEDCKKLEAAGKPVNHVSFDTRLDHRWVDLRTQANQGIMRIKSMVATLFREFLLKNDFMEMHTPKLIGGASEGGAEVFTTDYFGRTACLAQSPQLYKQMVSACSGFERVFEIGPVFRAETSRTKRHLCEFTGLDMEMIFNEHYHEVLDIFSGLFCYIFEHLEKRCGPEIAAVQRQYPFRPMKWSDPALLLTFAEGIQLLNDDGFKEIDGPHAGEPASTTRDLSHASEHRLGEIVYEKYQTDFFMMDKYPMEARPFYTMPDPDNAELSNSYDFFIRGTEILSGAQRVHDPDLLTERAIANDIDPKTLESYIESFRHGAEPHGGGGIGLDRVVQLYLGLDRVQQVSMFPRTPVRLTP